MNTQTTNAETNDVITDDARPSETGAPAPPTRRVHVVNVPWIATPYALVVLGAVALLAWPAAPRVAFHLGRWLPAAAVVRSRGTPFPALPQALPFTLRATAFALLAASVVGCIARFWPRRWRWTTRVDVVAVVLVVLAGAAIYGFFGYPHNAIPTNSRIHWVDIYNIRADSWFYALVKLPHRLFYNEPYALQAINGAVNVALMYLIGRTIFRRGPLPVVLALTYLGSSLMLAFANTAEDVQLNVAALLFAYLMYLRRSTPWLGIALFVVVLGRPQLVYISAVVVAVEFLVQERREGQGRFRNLFSNRFLLGNVGIAAGIFVAWDVFLTLRHQNWFLHNGRLIDTVLVDLKPLPTDGFTISAFSGAYILHGLWIFPAFLTLGAIVALVRIRELPNTAKRALLFGVFAVGGGVLISEAEPLFYFNFRYLAYLFPLLAVAAFTCLVLPARRRRVFGVAALAALLCFGAATTHWQAFEQRRQMLASPIVGAFADRGHLRSLIGDAPAGTTSASIGDTNYISYLLRRRATLIKVVTPDTRFRGYVFSTRAKAPPGETVYSHGQLVLVRVG
jgi:hypothetical protein